MGRRPRILSINDDLENWVKLLKREDIDSMVYSLSWGRRISRMEKGDSTSGIVSL